MECEALGKQAWCGVCDHWRRLVEAYRLDVFHAATHWVGRCSSTKRAAAGWGGKSLLIRATIASQVRVCTARAKPAKHLRSYRSSPNSSRKEDAGKHHPRRPRRRVSGGGAYYLIYLRGACCSAARSTIIPPPHTGHSAFALADRVRGARSSHPNVRSPKRRGLRRRGAPDGRGARGWTPRSPEPHHCGGYRAPHHAIFLDDKRYDR